MLARLTLYLEETDLSYQKMSLFHGALMEMLPPDYNGEERKFFREETVQTAEIYRSGKDERFSPGENVF